MKRHFAYHFKVFILLASSFMLFGFNSALAQEPQSENQNDESEISELTPVERALANRRAETLNEINEASRDLTLTREKLAALKAEIDGLKRDENTITASLIQSAKTEKKLGDDIATIGSDLVRLSTDEESVRLSLDERAMVLGEVLAALQRMGLNPPPALLVQPEDALASVRSAIILGAVVPEMRDQTLGLRNDLNKLSNILEQTKQKQATLRTRLEDQIAERERFDLLLAEKQTMLAQSATSLTETEQRNIEMAQNVTSLKDLLLTIERKIDDVAQSAKTKRDVIARAQNIDPSALTLGPTLPFGQMVGQMGLPVRGTLISRFGQNKDDAFAATGDTIATLSGSIVISPVDAVVAFAAPFRSYGKLVILDVGDNYTMVLAGIGTLAIEQGQTVLAGEPLGTMSQTRVASAAATGIDSETPELYIEFRKNGQAIDPGPWWRKQDLGMVGNDA